MTIFDKKVRGRPINPGLALYKFWHGLLIGLAEDKRTDPTVEHRRGTSYFGQDGWRLAFMPHGPVDTPNITFGGSFVLNSDGEFQLIRPHGIGQRNILARGTFLDWTYWRGYNWFVNTSVGSVAWEWHLGGAPIKDWRNPRHYVNEATMGARRFYYAKTRPWLKVAASESGEWQIVFSRSEYRVDMPKEADPISQKHFDRFDALRERRYRLMERHEKLMSGEWTLEDKKIVTPEEREERQSDAVQVIMAHFDIREPARTVPLRRRDREEEGLWPLPLGSR